MSNNLEMARVKELVGQLNDNEVFKMMDVIGERFDSSPASTNKKYHGAFTGGLVKHSLKVVEIMLELPFLHSIDELKIIKVGLFHDLGKIGDLKQPQYIYQSSQWHRDKLGQMYTHNDNVLAMNHAQRSIFILQHFGVKLSADEFQAILFHDGQYIEDNKSVKMKEMPLTLLLHWADVWAVTQERI